MQLWCPRLGERTQHLFAYGLDELLFQVVCYFYLGRRMLLMGRRCGRLRGRDSIPLGPPPRKPDAEITQKRKRNKICWIIIKQHQRGKKKKVSTLWTGRKHDSFADIKRLFFSSVRRWKSKRFLFCSIPPNLENPEKGLDPIWQTDRHTHTSLRHNKKNIVMGETAGYFSVWIWSYDDRLKAANESPRRVALRAATSFSSSRIESNLFFLFTCSLASPSQA